MAEATAADVNVISEHGRSPVEPQKGQGPTVQPVSPGVSVPRHEVREGLMGLPARGPGNRTLVEGVRPPENSSYRAEVVTGIQDFAIVYAQKLIDMQGLEIMVGGNRVNAYEAMKQQQAALNLTYLEDEALLAAFSEEKDGKRQLKSPDEIRNIISSHPAMMESVMVVAERYARDTLAAMGLRAEMQRPGSRTDLRDLAEVIDFPTDQGKMREVLNRLGDALRRRETSGGRTGPRNALGAAIADLTPVTGTGALLGGATGAFVGGVVGNVPGAIAGAVEGATAGAAGGTAVGAVFGRSLREGPRLILARDQDVATAPTRAGEDLRAKYLLDVDPIHLERSTAAGDAKNEAIGIIMLRWEYLASLGVPRERMDALSIDFVNNPDALRPEESRTKFENEIFHRFETNGGMAAGITQTQRRDIYRRSQQEAIMDRFQDYFRERQVQRRDVGQLLTDAISARGEGGTALKSRISTAEAEQQRLQVDRTSLEGNRESIAGYRGKVTEVEATRASLTDMVSRIVVPGSPPFASAEDATDAIEKAISDMAGPARITIFLDGRSYNIENIAQREQRVNAYFATEQARIAALPPKAQDKAIEAANNMYERQMKPINEDTQKLDQVILRIKELNQRAKAAGEQALTSPEATAGIKIAGDIATSETTLTGWGVNQATIEAGDYAAILAEIHAQRLVNPANGWPENEDNLPENRLMVRRAIVQARARLAERGDPTMAPMEANYNLVRGRGLTLEQLVILDLDELERRYVSAGGVAATARGEVEQARTWAKGQLRFLEDSVRLENDRIQTAETDQARLIRNVNMATEIAQLTMVRDIFESRGRVKSKAAEAYFLPDQRAALEDVAHVRGGRGGYTAAEQASNLPRNMLEVLNILTNYQNAPDRNGAFQQIWRNLGSNPDLLLSRLGNAFGIRSRTIDAFSRRLRDQLRTGATAGSDFGRNLGENTVNEFAEWGLSIST